MAAGVFGSPLAIPFERVALGNGQLLLATTDTNEPAGITAGNAIEQEFVVPVTTAPGTEVVHV
jgi:hypothetical protein